MAIITTLSCIIYAHDDSVKRLLNMYHKYKTKLEKRPLLLLRNNNKKNTHTTTIGTLQK